MIVTRNLFNRVQRLVISPESKHQLSYSCPHWSPAISPKGYVYLICPESYLLALLLSLNNSSALDTARHLLNWGPTCWNTKAHVYATQCRYLNRGILTDWLWTGPHPCCHSGCIYTVRSLWSRVHPWNPGPGPPALPWVSRHVLSPTLQVWGWAQFAPGNEVHAGSLYPTQSSNTTPMDFVLQSTELCPYATSGYR